MMDSSMQTGMASVEGFWAALEKLCFAFVLSEFGVTCAAVRPSCSSISFSAWFGGFSRVCVCDTCIVAVIEYGDGDVVVRNFVSEEKAKRKRQLRTSCSVRFTKSL